MKTKRRLLSMFLVLGALTACGSDAATNPLCLDAHGARLPGCDDQIAGQKCEPKPGSCPCGYFCPSGTCQYNDLLPPSRCSDAAVAHDPDFGADPVVGRACGPGNLCPCGYFCPAGQCERNDLIPKSSCDGGA